MQNKRTRLNYIMDVISIMFKNRKMLRTIVRLGYEFYCKAETLPSVQIESACWIASQKWWKQYKKEWLKSWREDNIPMVVHLVEAEPDMLIQSAFKWDSTKEGHSVWESRSKELQAYIRFLELMEFEGIKP